MAHRLNLAAQWWRIVDLESGRPSPKSVASCVLAAYGNAQRLVKLLGARHDLERGIARPHPALRRLLNEARTSRTGEANPQESIGCDLKSLLRLAQDLEAATRQLGHPDDVESEKPSQADPEMDEFVQSLQRIWEDVIGRRAATSVTSETKSRKGGEATGPFVKFVVGSTHMLPGQEKQTAKALRARIRRVLKQRVTPAS